MPLAQTLLHTPWLRPFNDLTAWDDLLSIVLPSFSLREIRAVVLENREESPGVRTLVVRPGWRWPGFVAGQHAAVTVEHDGVRHTRVFSISSAPTRRDLSFTIQKKGKVTQLLHALAPGAILTLSAPEGRFVLPTPRPPALIFLAAGSGVTPLASMIGQLAAEGYAGPVTLLQLTRGAPLLARTLAPALQGAAALKDFLHLPHDTQADGRLSARALLDRLPTLPSAGRTPDGTVAFLCGPGAWMEEVQAELSVRLPQVRVLTERFGPPPLPPLPPELQGESGARAARIAWKGQVFSAGERSVLEAAEAAGLQPRFGCRMGICHQCTCTKAQGTVRNIVTGKVSDAPGEAIQICVSQACSDVVLS